MARPSKARRAASPLSFLRLCASTRRCTGAPAAAIGMLGCSVPAVWLGVPGMQELFAGREPVRWQVGIVDACVALVHCVG